MIAAADELERDVARADGRGRRCGRRAPVRDPASVTVTNFSAVSSGALPIAARDAFAADAQLARHADRRGPSCGVEHVDRRVGDRVADRDVTAVVA